MSLPTLPPIITPAGPYVGPVPAICFSAQASNVASISNNPARWTMRLDANTRSIYETETQYDTRYLKVGQWYANQAGGYAFKIVAISFQNDSYALCTCEDEDFFNEANYPTNPAQGPSDGGVGYIFELSPQGVPMLTQIDSNLTPSLTYITDLQGAFASRNRILQYVRVAQTAHGFAPGNFIYLSTADQLYHKSNSTTSTVYNTIGLVTSYGFPYDSGVPNPNFFCYAPFGQYYPAGQMSGTLLTILPPLDPVGTVYYVDSTGGLTSVKPSNAFPAYIKISTGGDAICLKGQYGLSAGGGGGTGPTGPAGITGAFGVGTSIFTTTAGSAQQLSSSSFYFPSAVYNEVDSIQQYGYLNQGFYGQFRANSLPGATGTNAFYFDIIANANNYLYVRVNADGYLLMTSSQPVGAGPIYTYSQTGTYSTNDLFALYMDGTMGYVYQNNSAIYSGALTSYPLGSLGYTLKMYTTSTSVPAFTLADVLYYPTAVKGLQGLNGAFGPGTFTWVTTGATLLNSATLQKSTNSLTSWNSAGWSAEKYPYGAYVSFQPSVNYESFQGGFVTQPTNAPSQSWLDYGWSLQSDGIAAISYSGATGGTGYTGYTGSYLANDTFQVNYDGLTMQYLQNGLLKYQFARTYDINNPIGLGMMLGTDSVQVNNIHFGPNNAIPYAGLTGCNIGWIALYVKSTGASVKQAYISQATCSSNISTNPITIVDPLGTSPSIVLTNVKTQFAFPSSLNMFGAAFDTVSGLSGDPITKYWNVIQSIQNGNLLMKYYPSIVLTTPNQLVIENATFANLGLNPDPNAFANQFTSGSNVLCCWMVFNLTSSSPF